MTILMIAVWDSFLSFLFLIKVFQSTISSIFSQTSVIFFILAYSLAKIAYAILKKRSNSILKILLKLALFFCCSLLITVTILYLTNSEDSLILLLSFICLPQIYKNAVNKKVSSINSLFFYQIFQSRFIMVLYLKLFPFNAFELRPNFEVVLTIAAIIGAQLLLLKAQ